jgi:hypothetical protein
VLYRNTASSIAAHLFFLPPNRTIDSQAHIPLFFNIPIPFSRLHGRFSNSAAPHARLSQARGPAPFQHTVAGSTGSPGLNGGDGWEAPPPGVPLRLKKPVPPCLHPPRVFPFRPQHRDQLPSAPREPCQAAVHAPPGVERSGDAASVTRPPSRGIPSRCGAASVPRA